MNHVIGEALVRSHPKETARIMRENKQFVTLVPRGTPRHSGERTEHRPHSVICMVADPQPLPADDTVNAIDTRYDTHGVSFDETVQIMRVAVDDSISVNSEESEGILDYGPIARIAVYQDVSIGVHYDEQLIDHLNANWDEELTATQELGTWATYITPTELVYEEDALAQDTVEFYGAWENPQEKCTPANEQS
jgi:hypothetical protein